MIDQGRDDGAVIAIGLLLATSDQAFKGNGHGFQLGGSLADVQHTLLGDLANAHLIGLSAQRHQRGHIVKGKAQLLRTFDETQAPHVTLVVLPKAIAFTGRLTLQPATLVKAHRFHTDPCGVGELANGEGVRGHERQLRRKSVQVNEV